MYLSSPALLTSLNKGEFRLRGECKVKFNIRMSSIDPFGYLEEIEGEPITIMGYDQFPCFIHKRDRQFIISELKTGLLLVEGRTKAGAILALLNKLRKYKGMMEKLLETRDEYVKTHGVANTVVHSQGGMK